MARLSFEEFLVQRGKVRREDLEKASRTQNGASRAIGEVLVASHLLSAEELNEELERFYQECRDGPDGEDPGRAWRGEGGFETASAGIEEEKLTLQLKSLYNIVKNINSSLNLNETLENILNASMSHVKADYGLIAVKDSESNTLLIKKVVGEEELLPEFRERTKWFIDFGRENGRGIAKLVARTKRLYISNNVESEKEKYYLKAWPNVQSNVSVPILDDRKELIGVILLESKKKDAFCEADGDFLLNLANLAALAIEKTRAFEHKEKEKEVLLDVSRGYHDIDKGVITEEGTNAVLSRLLDLCFSRTGAKNGFISLVSEGAGILEIRVIKGEDILPEGEWPRQVSIGEGIVGKAAETGQSIIIKDVEGYPNFIPYFQRIRSELAVPIPYYNKVIGVINIESKRPGAFSEEDVQYFEEFARIYASFIRAAQFYEYTRTKFGEGIEIIGISEAIKRLKEMVVEAARSEATILVEGESGTGKEYIAKYIHFNSRRQKNPFEALSCISTQPELIESELFGHVKGAFTGAYFNKIGLFELAGNGTIFLDEIGDLRLDLQGKLLRILQEGTYRMVGSPRVKRVDVRVIAASNKRLRKLMQEGKFRDDLYYRLEQVSLFIPPLRERREDIPPLVDHFAKKYCKKEKVALKRVSEEAKAVLWKQDWPGNIRELENFIYRAIIYTKNDVIEEGDIHRISRMFHLPLKLKIDSKHERAGEEIVMALRATRKPNRLNKTRAALYLGWDTNTLVRKIKSIRIREKYLDNTP